LRSFWYETRTCGERRGGVVVSTCMRTIFDAKGDAGVRVVGADAQHAPVGKEEERAS
jgi:hypothetical protein